METKLEISTYIENIKQPVYGIVNYSQQIEFKYDKYIKGKLVAITLKSNDGTAIDAPDINIYLKNADLKKILEFLIESEK